MSKLKITKGKAEILPVIEGTGDNLSIKSSNLIGVGVKDATNLDGNFLTAIVGNRKKDVVRANAELIADAFNTANETDKLPSELRQERDELKKRLQSLVLSMSAHPDCTEGSEFDDLSSLAQELINKIENNE